MGKEGRDKTTPAEQARKKYIVKSTDMIQKSRYSLTLNQNKMLVYLMSKIESGDEPGKLYVFDCREFQFLVRNKSESYTFLKNMLKELADKSWWLVQDDGTISLMRWLTNVNLHPHSAKISVSFNKDLYPYILNLKELIDNGNHYFSYRFQDVCLMTAPYSLRMYELIKSYSNNPEWVFEYNTDSRHDLLKKIAPVDQKGELNIPKSWHKWSFFNRDVLKPAMADINRYTVLNVEYEPLNHDLSGASSKGVSSIRFLIKKKSDKELEKLEEMMAEEYGQHSSGDKPAIEAECVVNEAPDECVMEENVEPDMPPRGMYPLLEDELGGKYTVTQIDALARESFRHLDPGRIPFKSREMWACDFVMYYSSLVDATPEDTKTTPYRRLFDLVRNDYDSYAIRITNYDKERAV